MMWWENKTNKPLNLKRFRKRLLLLNWTMATFVFKLKGHRKWKRWMGGGHIPSFIIVLENLSLLKGFAKISTIWSCILQILITTSSLCLVLIWWIGFFAMVFALVSSHMREIVSTRTLNSLIYYFRRSWEQHEAKTTYSVTADKTTQFFLCVQNEISVDPR